jgi:aflatoxin B1 aldehyde reductase
MSNIVLGTMNINYPYSSNINSDIESYKTIIECYLKKTEKNAVLDTAYYYGNTSTEKVIGEILPQLSFIPQIATKVNPWFNNDFTNGKLGQLSKDGIVNQLNTSLSNLKLDSVDTLYLHCPDYETPIEETLETCDMLWRREKFHNFGISNFSLDQLKEVINISEKYSYINPTYYQGMYNIISRKVEEVFPLLEEYGIEFWGYNPLAGGLLTGKYKDYKTSDNISENSRFKDNKIYQSIFWKPEIIQNLHSFFDLGTEICTKYSLKWLQKYSKLNTPINHFNTTKTTNIINKIVLGVSNVEQLNTSLNILSDKTELDMDNPIDYFNDLYEPIVDISPNYWY